MWWYVFSFSLGFLVCKIFSDRENKRDNGIENIFIEAVKSRNFYLVKILEPFVKKEVLLKGYGYKRNTEIENFLKVSYRKKFSNV